MLISPAFADGAVAAQADPIMSFLPMVAIFVVFYFMIIRPQVKRGKEQKQMQEALSKGDEVVTSSGQLGKIVKISELYVRVDNGAGVESVFQRSAIQAVLPKGTLKDI